MTPKMPFAPTTTFEASQDVVATEQADMSILMDLRRGRYFTLNPVGRMIWTDLAAGARVDQMTSRLRDQYGIPAEQAMVDVQGLLGELVSERLIQLAGRG